jgi:PKD repeat protein
MIMGKKNSNSGTSRREILELTSSIGLTLVIGSSSATAYNHGEDINHDPDTGSVSFISPEQGASEQTPVAFEMEATDFIIEPAGNGLRNGAGHFHILVDQNPLSAGEVIPNNEENGYYHYGGGQETAEIQMAPGEHTVYLQAGDAEHRAYTLTDSVDITVEEAADNEESTLTMDNSGINAWVVPSADEAHVEIAGETNPTITLETGIRYTVSNEGWNRHPVAFYNEQGELLLSQEPNESGAFENDNDINWSDSGSSFSFTLTEPLAQEINTYICTVHNQMEGSIQVEFALDVTGNGDPAQDLDGDGLYEDVDGNGEANIFDVQALFENQDAAPVQNNAELFNFDGQNGIDIFDIQSLFEQL